MVQLLRVLTTYALLYTLTHHQIHGLSSYYNSKGNVGTASYPDSRLRSCLSNQLTRYAYTYYQLYFDSLQDHGLQYLIDSYHSPSMSTQWPVFPTLSMDQQHGIVLMFLKVQL